MLQARCTLEGAPQSANLPFDIEVLQRVEPCKCGEVSSKRKDQAYACFSQLARGAADRGEVRGVPGVKRQFAEPACRG